MAKKTKSKGKPQQKAPLTNDKYIMKCARQLPVVRCVLIDNSFDNIKAAFIIRAERNGLFSAGAYLIDTWCRGVYDTLCEAHLRQEDVDRMIDHYEDTYKKDADYAYVHNLVLGAVEFAQEAGIPPHKDFKVSQYMLDEDTDDIPLIEFEFGLEGKHALECSNQKEYLYNKSILEKNLQPDQYTLLGYDEREYEEEEEDDYVPLLVTLYHKLADTKTAQDHPELLNVIENAELYDEDFDAFDGYQKFILMTIIRHLIDDVECSDELKSNLSIYDFLKAYDLCVDKNVVEDNEDPLLNDAYELLVDSYFDLLDMFEEYIDDKSRGEDVVYLLTLFAYFISTFTVVLESDISDENMDNLEDEMKKVTDRLDSYLEFITNATVEIHKKMADDLTD